jgi:hypothetical protein
MQSHANNLALQKSVWIGNGASERHKTWEPRKNAGFSPSLNGSFALN